MSQTLRKNDTAFSMDDVIMNRVRNEDSAAHDWYRFVLSYPPHLVRTYLEKFNATESTVVLDPFCGTGTTVVECKKNGVPSIGIEASQFAAFAGCVKTNWRLSPNALVEDANCIADAVRRRLSKQGVRDSDILPLFDTDVPSRSTLRTLSAEKDKLIIKNSISPLPLHKTLELIDAINDSPASDDIKKCELLAVAKSLVNGISNLYFGPEVGVRKQKADAPVVSIWLNNVIAMSQDIKTLNQHIPTNAMIINSDARNASDVLADRKVDIVITSPPYPNEKDYTRTTRLESVLLGFINTKDDLRLQKKSLLRSNTRGVYKTDDDDADINDPEIDAICEEIESKRIKLGKTSGFERMYARVTKLYFGGMKRHFVSLSESLNPGATLAYVVGDQASYLQTMIRTGQILSRIAETVGYKARGIDLFRKRIATATGQELREEIVLLEWQG